tara:strand:- start:420 stop:1655 length:1236 start_codon:yes stop_codon:yes gene_type:complete
MFNFKIRYNSLLSIDKGFPFVISLILANIFSFYRTTVGLSFQAGMFLGGCLLLLLLLYNIRFFKSFKSIGNVFFLVFIVIEIFSFLLFYFNPVTYHYITSKGSIIILSIVNFLVVPKLFFYLCGSYIGDNIQKGIKQLVYINSWMMIVGLLLTYINPGFYDSYLHSIYGFESFAEFYRFLGYLDNSMTMGILAAVNIILALSYSGFSKPMTKFYVFISAVVLITTLQRGAWISFIIGLIVILVNNKEYRVYLKQIIPAFLVLVVIFVLVANFSHEPAISKIVARFLSIPDALIDRIHSWGNIWPVLKGNFLGGGLGSTSHKCTDLSPYSIPDANYFRIIADIGFLGFLSFLSVVLYSTYRLRKNGHVGLYAVVLMYLFQAIGTNVFDLYYSSFIFWFIIGFGINVKIKSKQ